MRFITSDPIPADHKIGPKPISMVATVMNLGRMRFTAPCRIASRKPANVERK